MGETIKSETKPEVNPPTGGGKKGGKVWLIALLVVITIIVLIIVGGVIWWKVAGKKMIEEGIGKIPGFIEQVVTKEGEGIGIGNEINIGEDTAEGDIGKMTDEIYIEMLAQSSVGTQDLKTYAARIKALYVKYGVTEADIKAYAKELEKDPQHYQEVAQKYMQRAMELRNTGE